jgi:hypothetical protein
MPNGFFPELRRRNAILHHFGWLMMACYALACILYFTDDTIIMGINAWIKPMKFALSITIYAWTFGWLLGYSENQRTNRAIAWGIVLTMTVEIALIYLQAYRGTTSHFNVHTPLDGMIFGIMGIFILLNTLINAYVLWLFFRGRFTLTGSALFAWRSGLLLFLLGSISGGWMVQILSHTVGAPDGGPGLPFVNWSTVAGDIRAAHFVSLHGIQLFPVAALLLTRSTVSNTGRLLQLLVAGYFLLCAYLHVIAWLGLPVLPRG